jgi:predicted GNAT family acetyltransferase
MKIVHHEDGAALAEHTRALLEAREVENGLILSICAGGGLPGQSTALWMSVEDSLGTVGVAICTPPFNLVVTRAPKPAIEALVADLVARGHELPGVTGPVEPVTAFAEAWTRGRPLRSEITMRQGIYELTRVVPPDPCAPGHLRLARAAERDLLSEWALGFARDSNLAPNEQATAYRSVAARMDSQGLFVWEDGTPVSMAALAGTPRGARVGWVYTPPELRRRGYATACVAALSALALASGRRFCTLYTDLANPTSNAIYQQVGYRFVTESWMVAFSRV